MSDISEENSSGNIQVICRFRPLNEMEIQQSEISCVEISDDNKTIKLKSEGNLKFSFDHVFGVNCNQKEVYDISAKPIVEAVMQGFNGTVFAYGQSSSGKTYTMTGPDIIDPISMGVIPRMVATIFDGICKSESHIEYTVKVSYCEIYLEKIRDLLDLTKDNLKVRESKARGVFIDDITERYASSDFDIYEIIKFGLLNRNTGSTNINEASSRSHSIFSITFSQTNNRDYSTKTGQLHLIDLAGSEKVSKSGAAGKRLEEAKNINKSLTTLGLVIYSLTDGKSAHIPYRDSKLTRILQDSLGGNSKTALIITCSPSSFNESETISTLRFGMRANSIKNTPKINREYTIAELKMIISKCKEELLLKDKKIIGLEQHIYGNGLKLSSIKEDSDENEENSKQETENVDDYKELFAELEDYRTRLAEEIKNSSKLKAEHDDNLNELIQCKKKLEVIMIDNKLMKEKLDEFEQILGEKENVIERLTTTHEILESDRYNLNQKLLELTKNLSEKDAQLIEAAKANEKHYQKYNFNSIKDLMKTEREVNIGYQKEIRQLRQNFNDLFNKKFSEVTLSNMLREEICRQEKDKWAEEKKNMCKEIQNKIDRVIELEMQLDDSKHNYITLESYLSEGERALKKKVDQLQRNVEELTLMYHHLTNQKSHLDVEKKLSHKRLQRNHDKIILLEQEVKKYKELYENFQQKYNKCIEDNLNAAKVFRSSLGIANIRKTIIGGTASARRFSLQSKNFFFIEEEADN